MVRTETGRKVLADALTSSTHLARRDVQNSRVRDWDRGMRFKQRAHLLQIASDKRLGIAVPDFHCELPEISLLKALLNAAKSRIFHNIHLGSIEMVMNALRRNARTNMLKHFRQWRRKRERSGRARETHLAGNLQRGGGE